ncbi:hypothetical protein [Streptomyces sp. NPDC007905]|uniref:hypothetical protein n=1 Tax=Streptomyces sp. NPDC007905 TaxID=3364788 RepID=UPI0036F0378E
MADGCVLRAPAVVSDAGALTTMTRMVPEQARVDTGLVDARCAVGASLTWVALNLGIRATDEESA